MAGIVKEVQALWMGMRAQKRKLCILGIAGTECVRRTPGKEARGVGRDAYLLAFKLTEFDLYLEIFGTPLKDVNQR